MREDLFKAAMPLQISAWCLAIPIDHSSGTAQKPPYRGAAHRQAAGNLGFTHALGKEFTYLLLFACRRRGTAVGFALLACLSDARTDALQQDLTLKFRLLRCTAKC